MTDSDWFIRSCVMRSAKMYAFRLSFRSLWTSHGCRDQREPTEPRKTLCSVSLAGNIIPETVSNGAGQCYNFRDATATKRGTSRARSVAKIDGPPKVRTVDGRPFSLKRRSDVSIWKLARSDEESGKNTFRRISPDHQPLMDAKWWRGGRRRGGERAERAERERR